MPGSRVFLKRAFTPFVFENSLIRHGFGIKSNIPTIRILSNKNLTTPHFELSLSATARRGVVSVSRD